MWYYLGYFGALAAISAFFKLRHHLPHRHDGYVAYLGNAWPCTVCGRLPDDYDPAKDRFAHMSDA